MKSWKFPGFIAIGTLLTTVLSGCSMFGGSTGTPGTVRMYVSDDGKRFITYQKDSPLVGQDGHKYSRGQLSPTWKAIEEETGINIVDTHPRTDKDETLIETELATGLRNAEIYGGNAIQFAREGQRGNFLALNKYLDQMPEFKQFLIDNPVVEDSVTAGDGNIYFSPYLDGIGGVERHLMIRHDIVKKVLDGDDGFVPSTSKKLNIKNYQPLNDKVASSYITLTTNVTVNQNTNAIAYQNSNQNDNVSQALSAFKNHLDMKFSSTNGFLENTFDSYSDMFIGDFASYDADDLIAFMRIVKASQEEILGEGKTLHMLFPRENKETRWNDLLKFMSSFGVRGVDSRFNNSYIIDDKTIGDARGSDEGLAGLERLSWMYEEDLILKSFTDGMGQGISNYRTEVFKNDPSSGKVPNGFMTYDYLGSTINSVSGIEDGVIFKPILPAVNNWFENDQWLHFSESSRSVKAMGIGVASHVTKNKTVLEQTLEIINYPFTEVGKIRTVFGPKEYYKFDVNGVENIDYMMFQGEKWPVITDKTKNEIQEIASGNWSNYYREYIGSTLAIGFVKSQSLEYQTYTDMARESQDFLDKAIGDGRLLMGSLGTAPGGRADPRNVVPSVFSTKKAEDDAIANAGNFGTHHMDNYPRVITGTYTGGVEELKKQLEIRGFFDQYLYHTSNAWGRTNGH